MSGPVDTTLAEMQRTIESAGTYEEREEDWLQAVGSALWNQGVEAGEWIGFQWESAQQTAEEIAKTPGDVVAQIVDGTGDIANLAVDKTADIIKGATDTLTDSLGDIAEDIGDTAKIVAIGGIVIALVMVYRAKG